MAEEYRWLVYMAGDNDLGKRIRGDVEKMKAGSSALVGVAALADFLDEETLDITPTKETPILEENTGSAATLTNFLNRQKNGAKHHVACIWSHAYGWLGAAFDEAGKQPAATTSNSRKAMMAVSRGLFKKAVRETVREATQTGVDESSRDFLDMSELRQGLQGALDLNDKFAIIGCDACYMAMLEVAYELRDAGEFLVASEEEEGPEGWDYKTIFGKFARGDNPKEAAVKIVEAYEPGDPRFTLSAIKLKETEEVAAAVNKLGARLTPLIGTSEFDAIKIARAKAHTFKLYHYIDLFDFAECLKTALGNSDEDDDIRDAADDVIKAVKDAVIATKNGAAAANAHGIAIYLPNEPVNENYKNLELARHAPKWAEFVTTYGANR